MSNKTSDKNVGSIEEDIEILERFKNNEMQRDKLERDNRCGGWKIGDIYKHLELNTAIAHLLNDYIRQKQINEEHQKINGELREKVKELEEERQLVGIPVRNKRDGAIGIVLHQWKSGSIAVLENINPRVINTHDSWSTLEIITDEIKQTKTKDDSISKQKIKDKIEELTNTKGDFATYIATSERIKVLQELLQESEDK